MTTDELRKLIANYAPKPAAGITEDGDVVDPATQPPSALDRILSLMDKNAKGPSATAEPAPHKMDFSSYGSLESLMANDSGKDNSAALKTVLKLFLG